MNPKRAIVDALGKAERVLICMHQVPDGDSAGSGLALGLALRKLGKTVQWVAQDALPSRIAFLPGAREVKRWDQVTFEEFPVAVAVDCGHKSRLGAPDAFWEQNRLMINIDHHRHNDAFGTLNWIDGDKSSTGEMVVELYWEAGWSLDGQEALCLYTAMSTDTLSFRQRNTTPHTFKAAEWVASGGLNLGDANRLIWDSQTVKEVRFLGWALESFEVSEDERLAWLAVPRQVMNQYQVDDASVDTVVQYLMSIARVEVAFLVRESAEGKAAKVSWRGRESWDVASAAEHFGGGGHPYAAAAIVSGTLADVVQRVRQELEAQ